MPMAENKLALEGLRAALITLHAAAGLCRDARMGAELRATSAAEGLLRSAVATAASAVAATPPSPPANGGPPSAPRAAPSQDDGAPPGGDGDGAHPRRRRRKKELQKKEVSPADATGATDTSVADAGDATDGQRRRRHGGRGSRLGGGCEVLDESLLTRL